MKIAVIGDHCLDIDYIGKYDGLMSREIEQLAIFNCHAARYSGGGAANIVELLHGLGAKPIPVGAMGDEEGELLMQRWDKLRINRYLGMELGQPTPSFIKYYQQSGQHIFRMNKKSQPLDPGIEAQIIADIRCLAVDALIVADYDETKNGIVTKNIMSAIVRRFPYTSPVLKAGSSRTLPEKLLWCNYVFMNEEENAGLPAVFSTKYVVTMGEYGAMVEYDDYDNGLQRESAEIEPPKRLTKDIDICGCGDSFLSAFVIRKLEGLPDLECLQWGNAAGRAQARKLYGAHTLTWDEIRKEYEELYGHDRM